MTLFARFRGEVTGTKIAIHTFMAVIAETERGNMTNAEALAAFDPPLSPTEQTEVTALISAITGGLSRTQLHDVLLLVERRIPPYDTEAAVKTRLGF